MQWDNPIAFLVLAVLNNNFCLSWCNTGIKLTQSRKQSIHTHIQSAISCITLTQIRNHIALQSV